MLSTMIGVAILVFATLISLFLIKRKHSEQPKQVKIIFFGLYFWGIVFLQTLICASAFKLFFG